MIDLKRVADVLQKTAAYIDEIDARKTAEERTVRTKSATDLAEKLSSLLGETINVDKLANLDPEVTGLLRKVAGTEGVDSLGGPRMDEGIDKKAAMNDMPTADARLIEFCLSE